MVRCICEICICGRHQCEHTKDRVPYAKGKDEVCKLTEHRDRYKPFCCQERVQPIIPSAGADLTGQEDSTVKISTTKRDYVAYPIQTRTLKKSQSTTYKAPKGKFEQFTTYRDDFKAKTAEVRFQYKADECAKDGLMPGTLQGRMQSETTYGRNYRPKPISTREQAEVKECTLTKLGLPFTGTTETKLSYQPPSYSKRETVIPRKGHLGPASGSFEDMTTHKIEFAAKPIDPAKPIVTLSKWKPTTSSQFRGTTTHAHDYKCPPPTKRRSLKFPQISVQKTAGAFEGVSSYKKDFPAHNVKPRKLPSWDPSSKPYKKSSSDTTTGGVMATSTYRSDFEPPPEELVPSRPLRIHDNLAVLQGSMEKVTSSMRDYKRIENAVLTKSFKPDVQYKKPEGKFANCTTTKCDFTAKIGDRAAIAKAADNNVVMKSADSMEDQTVTAKDFQWKCVDCPAKYLKLFGKDALPQYRFVEREKGHDYFKKLKTTKKSDEITK